MKWEHSEIRWASRWDLYLYMGDDQVHWFSIINSLAIVLLLTGIVAMILMRTLRRDLNRYNAQHGGVQRAAWRRRSGPRGGNGAGGARALDPRRARGAPMPLSLIHI